MKITNYQRDEHRFHLLMLYQVWPADSVSNVVKEIKGITAFELRKKHPPLLKLPCMWTHSYFAATVGKVSAEILEKYIAAQKGL